MAHEKVDLTALDAGTSKEAAQLPGEQHESSEHQASSLESSLTPADGGKAAWLFLVACWVIEAFVFGEFMRASLRPSSRLTRGQPGFGFSFGIFQDYLSKHEPFAGSDKIAVIGTTTMVSKCLKLRLVAAEADPDIRELCTWARQWSLHYAVSFPIGPHGSHSWGSSLLPWPW